MCGYRSHQSYCISILGGLNNRRDETEVCGGKPRKKAKSLHLWCEMKR